MVKSALILMLAFFATALPAAGESAREKTDSEIFNEGVDHYRAGDATNALSTLRPIMLSRTHGARAAEIVAKLEYDAARKPGAEDALSRLEEAASSAQIALRADPENPRLVRNFSLAVAQLPELRETRRIDSVIESSKNTPPQQLLKKAVAESRRLLADIPEMAALSTNDADRAVAKADECGAAAEKLADTWLSLKEAVCRAVTNEKEAAEISLQVDELRKKTEEAARQISDIDPDASYAIAAVEDAFTGFYKAFALPPEAIGEVIVNQSNACRNVAAECGRPWQNEALDFTRAFRAKFPAWAKAYEQAAAADTNKPPFTAETQAKIADLATRLEKLQIECVEKPAAENQRKALDTAVEISRLLPNDGKSDGSRNSRDPDRNRKNGKNRNDGGGDDKNGDPRNDGQNAKNDDPGKESENEDADGKDEKDASGDDSDDRETQAVLKKAQERSDEHEAEKKARMRRLRLPPNERDW